MEPLSRPLSDWARGRRAGLNFLTAYGGWLVCVLFLLLGLFTAGDYGVNQDEPLQRLITLGNLNYISGNTDTLEVRFPSDLTYGVSFELPLLLGERALGLRHPYHIHLLRVLATHLLFIIGAYCCYRLACRLFNNRWLALFALLLFLLHPRIYAHSFVNSKDLPFLSMVVIALYLLERALRRDTLGAFLLLGVAVGIATNLRIMDVMLFVAVIVMRAADLWCGNGGGPQRKHILLTGGLFALAAGLTLYVLTPYYWNNPLEGLIYSLRVGANHPTWVDTVFQGEALLSYLAPPHYLPTWFVITTPPFILLLGVVGIAALAVRGLSRPGAVWGNARLRLSFLLLACFLMPALAVILLGSNIYSGWRQMYFIYVPFGLLAAAGLYWLAAAGPRRTGWRVGLYGLIGLGLTLTALQIAQLHPLSNLYFNFLVDRTTPDYLGSRYSMDYWKLAAPQGMEYLQARHPGERLAAQASHRAIALLSPAERRRFTIAAAGRDPDYHLTDQPGEDYRPDLAFNSGYGHPVYNNRLITVKPLDSARMEAAAVAAYTELYRQALSREPVKRAAGYDLYLNGRDVVFIKEKCQPGDRGGKFRLRVYPPDPQRRVQPPSPEPRPGRLPAMGFYDDYSNSGVLLRQLGDVCLAVVRLPDRPITHFLAGFYQGSAGRGPQPVWVGLHSVARPGWAAAIDGLGEHYPGPTPGAAFDLFREGDRLIYYRQPCRPADAAPEFYLHIIPVNAAALPAERQPYGFENRDFRFERHGVYFEGQCLATTPLPDYPIAAIRTGQAGLWQYAGLPPVAPGVLERAAVFIADRQPEVKADFDLYLGDRELIYRRESCAAADTAAGFFLHITPQDAADLSSERRQYGFDNRDFSFDQWGGHFGGQCLAVVPLPDYPIATLHTGQYVAGQGRLWRAELAVEGQRR